MKYYPYVSKLVKESLRIGRGGGLEVELFADKAFLMDSGDFN